MDWLIYSVGLYIDVYMCVCVCASVWFIDCLAYTLCIPVEVDRETYEHMIYAWDKHLTDINVQPNGFASI